MADQNDQPELAKSKWMEPVGAFVIVAITLLMSFITVAPFVGWIPKNVDSTLLAQQQTIIQNVFVAVVMFFIGSSVGTRKKDDTINTLSSSTLQTKIGAPNANTQ